MASFSKGTSFTDGVTGDVTAAKLHALVDAATPVAGLVTDRTAKTSVVGADLVLLSDSADSNNLKKVSITNFANNLPTAVITNGTVTTLNSTTGTIPTLVATTLVTTGTGTAAAPAIVPTGDTNTGLFFPAADTIALSEGGAEVMRIDSSGNVGIGTNSPTQILDIYSATNSTPIIRGDSVTSLTLYRSSNDQLNRPNITLRKARGTQASPSAINSGDILGAISFQGFGGTNNRSLSNFLSGVETYTSDTNISSYLAFSTMPSGDGAAQVERLRIDSSGQVGIGTASPSAQLELSTDSAKKPSTNTWTIASDSRLKTNITDANKDRCLEIVRQIPLKRYTWKNEVYSKEVVKDRSKLGWIAQDVESVFPKAVGTNRFAYNQVFEDVVTPELDEDGNAVLDEDGNAKTKTEKRLVSEDVIEDCKDLNSDQIYAVMYGAIQKLAEENDSLKARIAALEAA